MIDFNKKRTPLEKAGMMLFMILFVTAVVVGIATLSMKVWNAIMPELFGLPAISFFQILGLAFLGRMIFGGGGHRSHRGRKGSHWSSDWKDKHTHESHSEGGEEAGGDKEELAPSS